MKKLIVAVSSRVLFSLDFEHQIFLNKGVGDYSKYQVDNENVAIAKGVMFGFIEYLLTIKHPKTGASMVEVVLVSRNHVDVGLRVFNSIEYYGLNITRAVFTNGGNRSECIKAFGVDLFLSGHNAEVKKTLECGIVAAYIEVGASE